MIVKPLLIAGGFLSLAVGAVGIFLPLLPTVPFVLLAAFCFARSSDRLHERLLRNRIFGPMIHSWETSRSIPRRAKYVALASIVVSGVVSVYLISILVVQIAVVLVLCLPMAIVWRLPVTEDLLTDECSSK